jgi:hypothetical protein
MTGLTRRALLRRGALAGLALALAGTRPAFALGQRSIYRGVALGPGGVGVEQSYAANRTRFLDTGTPWVRLWADWPVLQPSPDASPDFSRLDADVALAKADGLRVIVTAWRFAPAASPLPFGVPADLSPSGAWGRWIDTLIDRYGGHVDALEIVNEPNLQLAPQAGLDAAVATMIETATALAARHGDAPLLVGPATADVPGYEEFTRALLDRFDERGFRPGAGFAWSHHNYTDVEQERAGAANGVARVRALLAARWGAAPPILITESGARIEKAGSPANQAALLERSVQRLLFGPEGEGVAMVCQYLFITDPNYDSGLCAVDGTPRPAYYAWSRMPTAR